jgi:hypothetical protein
VKIIRLSDRRKRIKESGSMKVPMPSYSPYRAVYIFTKEASQLYGAGTKWCTTIEEEQPGEKLGYDPHDYQDMYPSLVYFIHKAHTIRDDPMYYKLALQVDDLWNARPTRYTYNAQDHAMSHDEFLQLLQIPSFNDIIHFLRTHNQPVQRTGPSIPLPEPAETRPPQWMDPRQRELDFDLVHA